MQRGKLDCPERHAKTIPAPQLGILLVVPSSAHLAKAPPGCVQLLLLLQTENFDLLLHLSDLELVRTEVSIVGHMVLSLLRGGGLDLADEHLARRGARLGGELELLLRPGHERRLGGELELLLRPGHERRLDTRRGDELLERVRPAQHTVRGPDEPRRRERDSLCRRDQALRPAVVALVKLLRRARPLAVRDDLLLRRRGRPDEPSNGIGDAERSPQPAGSSRAPAPRRRCTACPSPAPFAPCSFCVAASIVRTALNIPCSTMSPMSPFARPRSQALSRFATTDSSDSESLLSAPRESMSTRSGTSFHALGWRKSRLYDCKSPQPDVSRRLRHSDELIRRLVVLRESSDALTLVRTSESDCASSLAPLITST